MHPLHIVYVITRSDVIGGASAHLLDLAEGVQAERHRVTIIVGGSGIVIDVARSRDLNCISLPSLVREISLLTDIKCVFELRSLLQNLKPDLVHLHSAKAGIIGRLSAKLLGLHCVYTAHGWPFTEGVSGKKQAIYKNIERMMAYLTDRIITVSEFDKRIAIDACVASQKKITVVHNGVPKLAAIQLPVQSEGQLNKLIMVARFEVPKDHQIVINALSKIKNLNWTMEFVGDGPYLTKAIESVSSLELADRIVFSGACNDVPTRLAAADIFVLASRWEGFPLVILEAMRAGLPVIASDVGGVKESVEHNVTGILVPRSDEECMVTALERLISNPALRTSMGQRGRAAFKVNFTLETMLAKTLKVYEKALQ